MSDKAAVLIVDDEKYVRESLAAVFEAEGHVVATAESVKAALEHLENDSFDVVVTDLKMPKADGFSLLEQVRKTKPTLQIIMLTGAGGVADAVRAMKSGAFDFVLKPVDPDQLSALVEKAHRHGRMERELRGLRSRANSEAGEFLGNSPMIQQIRRMIEQVAPTSSAVLLKGESGTGKQVVAHEIHRRSGRSSGPLIFAKCSLLKDEDFDQTFFGATGRSGREAREGFFGAAAGGTLVLDEISALNAETQTRLLGALDAGEFQRVGSNRRERVNVRFIATTHQNLDEWVENGRFRSDLYFRLNAFPMELPPLRAREGDVRLLASFFAARAAMRPEKGAELDDESLLVLESHSWPGNVRELRNCIDRALILAGSRPPDAMLFRAIVESSTGPISKGIEGFNLRDHVDAIEKEVILKALAHTGGKKAEAAYLLGIDPKNFGYYVRKHRLADWQRDIR